MGGVCALAHADTLAPAQAQSGETPQPKWVLRLPREESPEDLQKRLPSKWKILRHEGRFVWAEGASVAKLSGFERVTLDEPLFEARWLERPRVSETPFSEQTLAAELKRLGGADSVRIREAVLEDEHLETVGAWESAARRACREARAAPVLFSASSAAPWILLRSRWFPSRATEAGRTLTEELSAQGCWGAHPGDTIFPLLMRLAQARQKAADTAVPVSLFLGLERWVELSLVAGERDAVRALNLAAGWIQSGRDWTEVESWKTGEEGLAKADAPECSRHVPACLKLQPASFEGRACREDLRLALSRCEKPEMAGVTALAEEALGTEQWQEVTRLLQLAESRAGNAPGTSAVPPAVLATLWKRYRNAWKKPEEWKWKIAVWLVPPYLEQLSRSPEARVAATKTLVQLLEATELRAALGNPDREPDMELNFLKGEFHRTQVHWGESLLIEALSRNFNTRFESWRQGNDLGSIPLLAEIRWLGILSDQRDSNTELGHWIRHTESVLVGALDTQVLMKGPIRSPATSEASDSVESKATLRLPAAVRELIRGHTRNIGDPTRFLSSQEVSRTNAAVGIGALRALSEEPPAQQEETARIRVDVALRALEGSISQVRLSLPLRLELQDAAFTVLEKHLPKLSPEGRQVLIRRLEGVLLGLDQRELKLHGMGRLARGAWNELWKEEARERLQILDSRQLALSLLAEAREQGSFQTLAAEELWWSALKKGLQQGDPPGAEIRMPRLRFDNGAVDPSLSTRFDATAAALADRSLEWVLRQFHSEGTIEASERIRRLLAVRGFEVALQARGPGASGVLELYSVLGDSTVNASPQLLAELRALKQRLRND